MHRPLLLCVLIASVVSPATAQKKPRATYQQKPGEKAIATEVPKRFVAAARACDNYAWAAAVEMLLREKQVLIPQRDWVMKAYGGYRCISPLATSNYAELVRSINGDYALTPDRRVRVEAEFTPGAPITPDTFIAAFRAGEPLMLVWKGKPYVWYGVVYDEYIHPVGNRMFELRELKLLDPLARTKDAQEVSFVKGKDDASQLDGVMRITVSPR